MSDHDPREVIVRSILWSLQLVFAYSLCVCVCVGGGGGGGGSFTFFLVSNSFLVGSVHIDPTSGRMFVRSYPITPTTCHLHYYLVLSLYSEDVQQETGIPGVPGQLPRCDIGFGRKVMPCIKPFPTQEDGGAKINDRLILLGSQNDPE